MNSMHRMPFRSMIAPSRANRTIAGLMAFPTVDASSLPAKHGEIGVVLLAPEVLGHLDAAALAGLLKPLVEARVLLCLTDNGGHALAHALAHHNIQTEILLGSGLDKPDTDAFILSVPPGTSHTDQIEFALTLSDAVVVAPGFEQTTLSRKAKDLDKQVIAPGADPPLAASVAEITRGLDPDVAGWHSRGRRIFGRLEQFLVEALAFNWKGRKNGGFAESRKKLRRALHRSWRPGSYFAPDGWEKLAPDPTARGVDCKLASCFDALDRSALYGSYIHRDLIWIAHFGAAFAVLFAVAGHLFHDVAGANHVDGVWARFATWSGLLEFAVLVLVALLVLSARKTSLQDRWTACRLGAEQLRIARMSLPLLVVPLALATSDKPPIARGQSSRETAFGFQALTLVKRTVRDRGLPQLDPAGTPSDAAKWVRLIVGDQIDYHHNNRRKLHHAEHRLRFVTQLFFYAAVIAVIAHFIWHGPGANWLLLLTAAGPAFAAAVHGTETRLGIVHRAALSVDTERELSAVDEGLGKIDDNSVGEDGWREVRRLTAAADDAMGRENTSWHGLVRRHRDELP